MHSLYVDMATGRWRVLTYPAPAPSPFHGTQPRPRPKPDGAKKFTPIPAPHGDGFPGPTPPAKSVTKKLQ